MSCHHSIAITAKVIIAEVTIVAIAVERNCSTSSSVIFVFVIVVVIVPGGHLPLGSVRLSAFGFVAGSACFDLGFRSGDYGRVGILDSERMRDHELCRHRV